MTKSKKHEELEQKNGELILDLQRLRADFENYRKRVDSEKQLAKATGRVSAILQLLPVIDTIERAVSHLPTELADNAWAQGVSQVAKGLEKSTKALGLVRIDARVDTPFDPEHHQAVQFDDGEGDHEVVAEELQAGYTLDGEVVRPAMVRVTKK